MQLLKIKTKKFGIPYGIYDISHDVSGGLVFNQPTTIQISNSLFKGPGEYNLFNFNYISVNPDYNLRSILDIQVPSGYTAYPEISGSSLIAKVCSNDGSVINKERAQVISSGSLTIEGPTEVQLDPSIFSAKQSYALFDIRTSILSGSIEDINVAFSGPSSFSITPPYLYGPYIAISLY
jgi:hypothetical protein